MCMGTSFCDNKEDLRQCKNKTLWENTTPMASYFQCKGSGQWIKSKSKNDGMFDCFNRRDEEEATFKKTNSDNPTQDWFRQVNEPCPNKTTTSSDYNNGKTWRKCLGNQPDKCVWSMCKFLIIKYLGMISFKQGQIYNRFALGNYISL